MKVSRRLHVPVVVRIICLLLAALSVVGWTRSASHPTTLLVIPARHTIVQFGFDVAKIRPIQLVSYSTDPRTKALYLYAWDRNANDWISIQPEQFRAGTAFSTPAAQVVRVGAEGELPAVLEAGPRGAGIKNVRVDGPDIVALVNTLNKDLKFTAREWKWLAKRYRLELEDRNAEARRWGRYGPPGTKTRRPQSVPVPQIPSASRVPEEPIKEPLSLPPMTQPVVKEKGVPLSANRTMTPAERIATIPPAEPAWSAAGNTAPEDK